MLKLYEVQLMPPSIARIIDRHLLFIIGRLYTMTADVIVGSTWIADILRYDLRLTISIYIALNHGVQSWKLCIIV